MVKIEVVESGVMVSMPMTSLPLFKRDPFHTVCRPSHRPHFFLFKPNGNALSGPQKNFPLSIGQLYTDQIYRRPQAPRQ